MLETAIEWAESNIPPWAIITLVAHGAILGAVAYMILLERKVASWAQDRVGPNRVGPFGLLQPIADGLKFLLKEDYRPKNVDKILFTLAPAIMIFVIILSIAVIPWGGIKQGTRTVSGPVGVDPLIVAQDNSPLLTEVVGVPTSEVVAIGGGAEQLVTYTYRYHFQIANLDIGVLFILAMLSLAVYGVVIGGWASNNKYSFLGGMRATANMISYEIPMGLAILAIVVMFGTLDLAVIVEKQAWMWKGILPAWNVFTQPLAFVLFLICMHAEANRAPFDTAEAEQELVGGYHTEYSSMRFALFFLAEYAGMITTSALCVALFFGGWHFPGLTDGTDPNNPAVTDSLLLCLIRAGVFFGKVIAIIFVFMWVRWSLPRFRFDQILILAWRALIPISLAQLIATALVIYYFGGIDNRAHLRIGGKLALILLAMNVGLAILSMLVSLIIPAAPETNRKIRIEGSRFEKTPLPAGT